MDKTYDENYNSEYDKYRKVGTAVTVGGVLIGGVGKLIANRNENKAFEIYYPAKQQYNESYGKYRKSVNVTKQTIEKVMQIKVKIMDGYMMAFLKSYRRLAPQIKLNNSLGINELENFLFGKENVSEIETAISVYSSYESSQVGKKITDRALIMVQDGTINNLKRSLDNVIDASLSGDEDVFREKLDELKIQSMSTISQFSVMSVEFGLSGITDAISSKKAISRAKEVAAEYNLQKEQIEIKTVKIEAIYQYAKIHLRVLEKCVSLLDSYLNMARTIIRKRDNIFHLGRIKEEKFTQKEMEILAFTASLVNATKAVIDSPILAKNGEVYVDCNNVFENAREALDVYERKLLSIKN